MNRKINNNPALKRALALLGFVCAFNAQADALFINDATVHTVSRMGVLQDADVLIVDGRIQAVGRELTVPEDATVIEAQGRPLTPGFFAGITGLGLVEISAVDSTVDGGLAVDALRPEFDVTPAYNPHSSLIPVTRIEGYSWSVLGANRSGSIIGGQGRAVSLDGEYRSFIGESVLFIDVGADASGQSGDSRAAQWMMLEQAMAEAAEEVRWSPDPLLTVAGRKTLTGFRVGGTVVFNVDRASDILQVIEFSGRHGLNSVISGGTEAWMVADRLAEAGIPVLLDALSNLPGSFDTLGARLDNAAILNEAGVTISFHGAETHQARKLRQIAGNAVANGLPFEAGLAAMTVNPAVIFSLGED
ncbi:MAG: amidohydrolase, partial [Gammaproteobacteria bacterium]|nr:amidohydrolase [Gammaproteobacteria bacterium]